MQPTLRLTQYSHGAGCGCKVAPQVLDTILATAGSQLPDSRLWIGNSSRDDAYDFGRISATNAISDIYAMGATPLMAIAILGWPIDKLPAEAEEISAFLRQ